MKEKSKILINLHSFRETYDLYYEQLCAFLSFYTRDVHVVEDIVHEVFLSLWENRDSVEIKHTKTYLFQSTKNKMLNHLRDEKNRSVLLEKWFEEQMREGIPETERFDVDSLLKMVNKAIDELPEKCKEIFILNKIENLPYKTIAETKNISIKTVENQVGIALKKIREFISKNLLLLILALFLFFF